MITEVEELGDTYLAVRSKKSEYARAFWHDAELILLDEPTSNLDSLNEGIILKSLKESAEKKRLFCIPQSIHNECGRCGV